MITKTGEDNKYIYFCGEFQGELLTIYYRTNKPAR